METAAEVGLTPQVTVLMSAMLETMAYGAFLVLCIKSLSMLRMQSTWQSQGLNRVMLAVTFTLFIALTAHWVLQCHFLFQAFIVSVDKPFGTLLYIVNNHNPVYLALEAIYVFVGVMADMLLIYRTYIVWARNPWVIVIPTITIITLAVSGAGVVIELAISPIYGNDFTSGSKPWITCSLAATLFTNLWCSAFITYRIRQGQLSLMEHGDGLDRLPAMKKRLRRTLHVFVESATLLTVVTMGSLICYLAQTSIVIVLINLAVPIVGICFCLIIMCVGGNVDDNTGEYTSATLGSILMMHQDILA